jgi:hypothetical protein
MTSPELGRDVAGAIVVGLVGLCIPALGPIPGLLAAAYVLFHEWEHSERNVPPPARGRRKKGRR